MTRLKALGNILTRPNNHFRGSGEVKAFSPSGPHMIWIIRSQLNEARRERENMHNNTRTIDSGESLFSFTIAFIRPNPSINCTALYTDNLNHRRHILTVCCEIYIRFSPDVAAVPVFFFHIFTKSSFKCLPWGTEYSKLSHEQLNSIR